MVASSGTSGSFLLRFSCYSWWLPPPRRLGAVEELWQESVIVLGESAFAPYVGFGVLMTSKLGTNVILMRYVAAISPMKDLKS